MCRKKLRADWCSENACYHSGRIFCLPSFSLSALWLEYTKLYCCVFLVFDFFFPVALQPNASHGLIFEVFVDHTQRRTTVGRTPLDEWSAHRRDLYLTTHNTHNRQTSMPPVGFEPTISAGERPQTHALDRAATGTGKLYITSHNTSLYYTRAPSVITQ